MEILSIQGRLRAGKAGGKLEQIYGKASLWRSANSLSLEAVRYYGDDYEDRSLFAIMGNLRRPVLNKKLVKLAAKESPQNF